MKTTGLNFKDKEKEEEGNLIQYAGLVVPGLFVIIVMAAIFTFVDKK